MRERKPTFGRRRCSGIWPPSKPGLTLPLPLRAYWPLWPRPQVLPRPEPMPRPTRVRSVRAPGAGLSSLRCMVIGLFLNLDEVVDLVDQAANLRAVLQFTHIVELAQAQGAHRQAVAGLGTTKATHQAHLDGLVGGISHGSDPPPSCRAWPRYGWAT